MLYQLLKKYSTTVNGSNLNTKLVAGYYIVIALCRNSGRYIPYVTCLYKMPKNVGIDEIQKLSKL